MRCQYRYLFHLILKLNLWLWLCLFWSCFSMFSGIRLHWFLKLFGHRTQTTQPSSLFCSCLNISIFTEFPQQSINRVRLHYFFPAKYSEFSYLWTKFYGFKKKLTAQILIEKFFSTYFMEFPCFSIKHVLSLATTKMSMVSH